ncbi:MAG: hypothetical protein NTU41_01585, partial [Chloroflexi bacterium]|nr:hypothetical protein [Chloroflexota bacterium]
KRLDVEQEAKVAELRDLLACAQSLRRKDFDSLMVEIRARRRDKEDRVAHTLGLFLAEQEELITWLRAGVGRSDTGLEEFKTTSQTILGRQREMEGQLGRVLRELHVEQEEMETGLRKLLQKGQQVRVKDLKTMLKAVHLRQNGRQDEVGMMLDELWGVEEELTAQWHRVTSLTRA